MTGPTRALVVPEKHPDRLFDDLIGWDGEAFATHHPGRAWSFPPGEEEADVAGFAAGKVEHLGGEVEALRLEVPLPA